MAVVAFLLFAPLLLGTTPSPGLSDPENIIVVGDSAYAPFEFLDSEGNPRGITVDIWRLWSSRTGVEVEYRLMEWSRALSLVRMGQADVVGGMFPSSERDLLFDFSGPYREIAARIFFHHGIYGVSQLGDLSGFAIGVVEADYAESHVRRHLPTATVVTYESNEALVLAALGGDVKAFVADAPVARFYLSKHAPDYEKTFRMVENPLYTSPLVAAVKKGNEAMLDRVNRGFDAIGDDEIAAVVADWTGETRERNFPWKTAALVAGLMGLVITAFFIHILHLRRTVRRSTRDIDTQKTLIQGSEARMRAILSSMTSLILEVDENGFFQKTIPSAYKPRLLDTSSLDGRNIHDILAPDVAEDSLARIREVLRTGRSANREVEVSPGRLYLDCTLTPLSNRTVLVVGRDVTDLRESERKYRELVEGANCIILRMDIDGRILFINEFGGSYFGYRQEELVGQRVTDTIAPEDGGEAETVRAWFENIRQEPDGFSYTEGLSRRRDGEPVWVAWSNRPIVTGGKTTGVLCIGNDITEARDAQAELRDKERYYSALIERSSDVIVLIDEDGAIRFISQSVSKLSGREVDEFRGGNLFDLVQGTDADLLRETINYVIKDPEAVPVIEILCRFDEERPHKMEASVTNMLHDTAVGGIIIHHRDVTEQKDVEEKLRIQAFFDPLTGLPNKTRFVDQLQRAMGRGREPGYRYAVLFIDLDRFKLINESLGHSVGDKVLQILARRIAGQVRKGDTVARYLGDKFVVLLEGIDDQRHVMRLIDRMQKEIAPPAVVGDQEIFISASIGVVFGSEEYQSPHQLVRDAETAMYRGKAQGKRPNQTKYEIFHAGMHQETVEMLRLETDLRKAVEREEFTLHYQPVLDLVTTKVVGVEALIRWNHPEKGMVSPMRFIPMAEEIGLIVPIGTWVMRQAFIQCEEYRKELPGNAPFMVGLNISVIQLMHKGFLADVRAVLDETGIDPAMLKLEITESIMMDVTNELLPVLFELKKMGVTLAIDDFGTGYSSLSYLHQFPFDTLKIDRAFVNQIGVNGDKHTKIIQTIMSLARHLDMSVIAEGIETEQQMERLRELGCPSGQGFLFSRPVEFEEFRAFHSRHLNGFSRVSPAN
ncbi:MAG: EAL domain-containing protein [Desulfatibacillaceae bacterium]